MPATPAGDGRRRAGPGPPVQRSAAAPRLLPGRGEPRCSPGRIIRCRNDASGTQSAASIERKAPPGRHQGRHAVATTDAVSSNSVTPSGHPAAQSGSSASSSGAGASSPPPLPSNTAGVLAALTALTGAAVGLLTSFQVVRWTPAQTTLAGAEVAAFWAFTGAIVAHLWPGTKQRPVAVAGTITALVSATVSLGIGFAWWRLNGAQNASLISLSTTLVAVGSALWAQAHVHADLTPLRTKAESPDVPVS